MSTAERLAAETKKGAIVYDTDLNLYAAYKDGDNIDIQIYFKAVPSAANQWIDVWIDIGGAVGELYRETFSFPKGSGTARGIMYSLASSYTLDTWESNGGTVYVRSNDALDIYNIMFNFDKSHKARSV